MKILLQHYPTEAYSKFEEVSYLLRHKHLKMNEFLVLKEMHTYTLALTLSDSFIDAQQTLMGRKKKVLAEGEEEPGEVEEVPAVGYVQNILADLKVFAWAGICFRQEDGYRLQWSLKKLAASSGATQIKFFGMIKGTQ